MCTWNLWHGCHKISSGCKNCYVYRQDSRYERDSSVVKKTRNFDFPIRKDRKGKYKIPPGTVVYTCFTSDFFLEDADDWRKEAWKMIEIRRDLKFLIITKRIDRFYVNLPNNWEDGYDNVAICCTVENQDMADYRLPIFCNLPIKHKMICCEPLLEKVDLSFYLKKDIKAVISGGESGINARICDYDWILYIRNQCIENDVAFWFKQTGAYFKKENKIYRILRKHQHSQAKKANINYKLKNSILDEKIN